MKKIVGKIFFLNFCRHAMMIGILIVSCESFTHSVDKKEMENLRDFLTHGTISWFPLQTFISPMFSAVSSNWRKLSRSFLPFRYATHDSNSYTLARCFSSSKLCFRVSYSTWSNGGIVVLLVSWKRMKCLKMLPMLFPNLSSRKIRKYGMDLISFSKAISYLISIFLCYTKSFINMFGEKNFIFYVKKI